MKVNQPVHLLKQELIKVYNSVNQEMYSIGVSSQRIEFLGDKIIIFAIHKRIPALRVLDEEYDVLTSMIDSVLIKKNKQQLAERLQTVIEVPIRTILKDYDPHTELTVTVIVLEDVLEF